MSDDIQRYFSEHATSFDRLYELPVVERVINHVFRRALYVRYALTFEHAGDVRGKRILDVGCGSGRYAIEFAKRGAAEVVGVDVAPPMLDLAERLAAREGVAARCRFVQGEIERFTDPRSFDLCLAIGVFDYIEDPSALLRHMAGLTRGRILASFPKRSLLRMRLRRARYAAQGLRVFFYERRDLERIVREAGLASHELIEIRSSGGGYFLVGDTTR